ncbi:MAG: hypothetical protein A3D53_02790 [Candidatus Magasanikbacteria bacterium RIFCSPHIGHO2_02_FULL_45_10]|uniref:O-antigen ligase-related domain-containing protein n=1 Tax=Candidatus Magasanikbacteria bacterium RIFCSPHIGHO2_02_FULL_45_10 TaxID=1798679 RepID=A0A1F6M9R9_9BACT|nr:MAG: hypothetical protein A3D53_02790 [Candidatus Magasanikbacteria bacterium RIFCSPHIGHO2_02_FULL_45_10]
MQQFLVRAIKILIYTSFFVPLLVLPKSFIFPFIVPKIVVFRAIVTAMAGCYGLLLLSNYKKFAPPKTLVLLGVSLFMASFTISTFTGVDSYHSFWDNHERMLGLFTILHYFIYFVIVSVTFKTWSDWKTTLQIFLLAGTAVMVIGVMQVGNPQLLLNQGSPRVASTLGNSIYVGGYGLFLFFVALLLSLKERNTVWRVVEIICAVFAILGMFYSGTRGSFLGWMVGLTLLLALYSIFLKEHRRIRHALWGIGGLVLVAFFFLYFNRHSPFVQNIPTVGRVLSTSIESVKNSPRYLAWGSAVNSWKERPVFGWGPNNFFYAYNQHYNPRVLEFGYGETWFDNAHNIIMNTLSVQGLFGVVSYLLIYIFGAIMLVRGYRRGFLNREIFIVGLAFLVSHLVQNITVFENPTSYLYFMFWLAMIASLSKPKSEVIETISRPITTPAWVSMTVTVFIIIFVFDIQPARANMTTINALRAIRTDPTRSVPLIKEAFALSTPHIDDIRSDLSIQILPLVSGYYQKIGLQKSTELLEMLEEALNKNIDLHPRDIRVYLTLNQLYSVWLTITNDTLYLLKSEAIAEESLRHSPRRQQIIYSLATIKLQLGKNAEAVKLLEGTLQDDPKIAEGYLRLSVAYNIAGQPDRALATLEAVKQDAFTMTPDEDKTWNEIMAALLAAKIK